MEIKRPANVRQEDDQLFQNLKTDPVVEMAHGPMTRVPRPRKPQNVGRKLLVGGGVVVAAALLVTAGYALAHHKAKPSTTASSTTSGNSTAGNNAAASSSTQTSTQSTSANASLATYTTTGKDLNLSFAYPSNWSVSPSSGGSSDQTITVTSPQFSLTDANGSAATGKAVVTIRPVAAGISEFTSKAATAGQNSVQMHYTSPAAGQHQYPYLTFIHFASGQNTNAAFEEVMITGTHQFNGGSAVTSDALAGLDPVISVAFEKCTTAGCTGSGQSALSITNATWQNNTTLLAVQQLFASLQLH